MLRRRTLQPAVPNAELVTRRNVTFSPRHGTRVITRTRRDASGDRTPVQDTSAGAPVVGTPAA
jgi:hypothetical protein